MKSIRKQWITLGACGAVLVVVAWYRLSGGGPATAESSPSVENPANLDSTTGIVEWDGPADALRWSLPEPGELDERFTAIWQPPKRDPFVMSPRVLMITSGMDPQGDGLALGESGNAVPEVSRPSFSVRSTFFISGRWFAEIDSRSYRVGDVAFGHRINRIAQDAIWVTPIEQTESKDADDSSASVTDCVMRVGSAHLVKTKGKWTRRANEEEPPRLAGGVEFEMVVGDEQDVD